MTASQRPDGALPVSQNLAKPGWSTPYGILLWNLLDGYEDPRRRACHWLLSVAGETHEAKPGDDLVGHDPSLAGWPWVEGTHSWIEPTAMAILALCREGFFRHPRVHEGTRMITDRALDHGGWNCGNKSVFGRELRPQPGPTALALLALAARRQPSNAVTRALNYLRALLPGVRSAVSVGWGVLALRAQNAMPVQAATWLAEAYKETTGRPDAVISLALLLLAESQTGPSLLVAPQSSAETLPTRGDTSFASEPSALAPNASAQSMSARR
jgi:hypothetical protein